jgi:hypothetical protein
MQAMAPAPDELAKSGPVANGTVVVTATPAGSLELRVNGAVQPHSDGPAGSASFATPAGTGELSVVTSPLVPLLVTAMVALWVVVALGCSGRLGSLIAGIGRLGRSSAKDTVDQAHSSDDGPNSGGDPT